jgi:DnaJ-class molecular chaperone
MNELKLEVNVEIEQIKKVRCSRCVGTGLIKRMTFVQCENCTFFSKFSSQCYLCENKNKSRWFECEKCFGSGEIEKKLNNNNINENSRTGL